MAQDQLNKFRDDFNKKLHEPNAFTNVLGQIEAKTGLNRLYLVAGVAGLAAFYLIFGYFAELLCNVVGLLYPAYISIKAIESRDKDDDTQWLTYWVIFALFCVAEFASDFILSWFPIYWLVKCCILLYLHMPMTRGAERIYTKFVRPFVLKHQNAIDKELNRFGTTVGDGLTNAGHAVADQAEKMQ